MQQPDPQVAQPVSPAASTRTPIKVALVGNPNSGKTTLFNALTGLNQQVANYPGITVEQKSAVIALDKQHRAEVIDLPGTGSLYPSSVDEEVTTRVLLDPNHPQYPDVIVVVADITNLRRSLLLCTQIMDLGKPAVLALNMADLADTHKLELISENIQTFLGIPTLEIAARKGWGVQGLKELLTDRLPTPRNFFSIPLAFRPTLNQIQEQYRLSSPYAAFHLLMQPETSGLLADEALQAYQTQLQLGDTRELIVNELAIRYDRLNELVDSIEREERMIPRTTRLTRAVDRYLLHPVWGYAILGVLLLMIFQALFSWATVPMGWIEDGFVALAEGVAASTPEGFLQDFLTNGLLAGLQGIVIFIPQIALLFLFVSVLEETGYMSRMVFLMDGLMQKIGLGGKSIVPLMGGFACAIPSIMMVRNIPNLRERLITILIVPLMSCSARIPVYIVLIGVLLPQQMIFGIFDNRALLMSGLYLFAVVVAAMVAVVLNLFIKTRQEQSYFVAELPVYRLPRWKNVGIDIYNKCKSFVIDAGKIILLISFLLWFLASFGPTSEYMAIEQEYAAQLESLPEDSAHRARLERQLEAAKLEASWAGKLGQTLEPVIAPLGYDWKIGIALITSFAAREVFVGTMNTLYAIGNVDETEDFQRLTDRLQQAKTPSGKKVYTPAVLLSLLVFYALAMQCMSTLAVVWRETNSWKYALFLLVYQTGLAYVMSLVVYQSAAALGLG